MNSSNWRLLGGFSNLCTVGKEGKEAGWQSWDEVRTIAANREKPGETLSGGRPYMYVWWGIRRIGEGEGSPSPGFHIYVAWICLCGSNLQYRRLLCARECFCSRKRHVETPIERRKWSESSHSPCHKIKDGGYNSSSLNKLSPAQNTPALRVNFVPPFELRLGCRAGLGLHNESDRSWIIHRKK